MTEVYHDPVLVDEVLRYLEPGRGGVYFDGTLGGGGHSEAILESGPDARVIAADRDPEALEAARRRLAVYGARFEARAGDFADVAERLESQLRGALLDLGVSSHQIDASRRGFSFREGSPLDMRMAGSTGSAGSAGRTAGEGSARTAADVLNGYEESELLRVLWEYGEEKRARAIVRRVLERREARPFERSEDLVAVLEEVYGARLKPQDKARVFQALRIEVNDELRSLERALPTVRDGLEPGGVLVVIAYHSLEDRRVKNAFRDWSRACVCPPDLPVCVCRGEPLGETLTRKVVRPSEREVERNPRSRSARLRAWRRSQ